MSVERTVQVAEGLPARFFEAAAGATPRGTLVLLHGVMSHSGWFVGLGEACAALGISVLAVDRRGSGRNRDLPGANDPSVWLDDVERTVRYARSMGAVTLGGWCWGGRLAWVAAARELPIERLLLLAPALAVKPEIAAAARRAEALPGPTLPLPFQADAFSDDPRVVRTIVDDRLAWTTQPREFAAANHSLRAMATEARVSVSTHVILASGDRIIDNEAVAAQFRARADTVLSQVAGGHAFVLERPADAASSLLGAFG